MVRKRSGAPPQFNRCLVQVGSLTATSPTTITAMGQPFLSIIQYEDEYYDITIRGLVHKRTTPKLLPSQGL